MIEQISYDDMLSYSKELNASAEVIKSLIENRDFKELENFAEEVINYSEYLQNIVDLNVHADEAIKFLKEQKRTSI